VDDVKNALTIFKNGLSYDFPLAQKKEEHKAD
jgi:hypothetical protein